MGYTRKSEVKVLRVKHFVTFSVGTRMIDLMEMFKHVPNAAQVDEVIAETDAISIEFHEEKVER